MHSEWSYDGSWGLSGIADLFGRFGCGAVLTAEHDATFSAERWQDYREACRDASTKKTVIIPGIEYSDAANIVHVLVWGISEFLGKGNKTGRLLHEANERKGFVVFAHPGRREAFRRLDDSWMPMMHGIELWNRKSDGIAPGRDALALLRTHPGAVPFVGLDFHRANQMFPLSMLIETKDRVSEESIVDALRSSRCRALAFGLSVSRFTQGPMFVVANAADAARRAVSRAVRHQ